MRQTELLNMQDVISFEEYDRWITLNRDEESYGHGPVCRYLWDICEENGYEPTGDDMEELEGELMFCIEQYSTLLYVYYMQVGVLTTAEADATHIMAGLHNDMQHDSVPF